MNKPIEKNADKATPMVRPSSVHLRSLDTLRGIDMLMIVGAATAVSNLKGTTDWAWLDWMATQAHHPHWHGFTLYDFIYPLFIFMVGVSLPFSIAKSQSMELSKFSIYVKAFKRMLIFYFLGFIYKNVPLQFEIEQTRFVSVLARLGITGFFTTIIYLNFNWKSQLCWYFGLIISYWLAVMFIPVPDYGAGVLTPEGCLPGYLDRLLLPGRLIDGNYDENGILCTIPAISLAILGALAGSLIRSSFCNGTRKSLYLIFGGIGLILLSLLWNLHFPINKYLWSSSFIALVSGMSVVSLGVLYQIIDVWKIQKWTFFFIVIGMNSITAYLMSKLIHFRYTSDLLFNGLIVKLVAEPFRPAVSATLTLALLWLFLFFLYKKKIFLKI